MPKCEQCGYKAKDVAQFTYNEEEDVWYCGMCSMEILELERFLELEETLEEKRKKEKVQFT